MLRRLPICMLLLISACSSQQQEQKIKISVEPEPVELRLAEHWQLSYFDDLVFNSKVAVLEAGNKHNPPVILIHGLGQIGMKDWFSVIPTLEKNYHVIAIDLPGFGLSAAKGRFLSTNYAHVIAKISKQYSSEKAIIIGHSMGGAVALRYTELYAELVKQLILVDAAGLLEKSAFIKHIVAFEPGDDSSTFVQQQIEGLNEVSSSIIEATTKSTLITNFLQANDYVWNWLVSDSSNMNAALSLVEEDFSQAVNQVAVPVNIIWGDKDNVAPLRTGKVLNKQMSHARLQVIKGAGHVPMKSHHADFMSALETALNEPITDKYSLPSTEKNQGILTCQGENDKTYSGHYDAIVVKDCGRIRLIDISTGGLLIKDSVVEIENLTFSSQSSPLTFDESVVTMTNADISGHNTMLINGSRLDMAGISIQATGDAVMVGNGSRISVSLSDINSPKYKGVVHGIFYLRNQPLIEQ
ncbi:alpha/beta fold hydrolase [Moritella viscosa]|nr:alpha/beta fold hydrolase [Moritella viscosa]CED60641.1 hydrolase, alpha/beta hydrolase fold [Moritella viscosa]